MSSKEGGKARGLRYLESLGCRVPEWFVIPTEHFEGWTRGGPLPAETRALIEREVDKRSWRETPLAVRSSALDEDSESRSFAGQYETVLGAIGAEEASRAVLKCYASAFSERVTEYRKTGQARATPIGMAVVVQRLIDAESSGVAFSRDSLSPTRAQRVVISSVWGLGEALVGGEEAADSYFVLSDGSVETVVAEKARRWIRGKNGIVKDPLPETMRKAPSLKPERVKELAQAAIRIEGKLGHPADLEWAIDSKDGSLYFLQARPIASLPPLAFFDAQINGRDARLWDNSNIIESYRGVTTPLTFTHVSRAYAQVYKQYCEIMGVPARVVAENDSTFRNMLGLVRGRVYYNLGNWYRMTFLFPGAKVNSEFMETMMGVKRSLEGDDADSPLGSIVRRERYSAIHAMRLLFVALYNLAITRKLNRDFEKRVGKLFSDANALPFQKMPLPELVELYHRLLRDIVGRWQAPIMNDVRCMIFFGSLKRLSQKWLNPGGAADLQGIQNDLLCGETGIESTEPAKRLVRLAARVQSGDPEFARWFLSADPKEAWARIESEGKPKTFLAEFREFLALYGYRSPNELKLEEKDWLDEPSFAIATVAGYLRSGHTSVEAMERREQEIRSRAVAFARSKLLGPKRWLFFLVLKSARSAVKDREALRLMRTRTFGMLKRIFRAMGSHLSALGKLAAADDVFYLSIDEIIAYTEGRGITGDLAAIARQRRREFDAYKATPNPPERFYTLGTIGLSLEYPVLLRSTEQHPARSPGAPAEEEGCLYGIPCCPGVIEGPVRVARTIEDAWGLSGEILVTETTDPGWVPLFPLCKALLVERGSLLSHSAVVAREFGVPTIVGVRGGLLERLKTGQRVRMDGSTGRIEIL